MKSFVTAAFVESLYNTFILHEPFKDFPDSIDVEFEVIYEHDCMGEYSPEPHHILISTKYCKTLESVIYTLLHEMIHMRMYLNSPQTEAYTEHDITFDAYSQQVCAKYFLDPTEL